MSNTITIELCQEDRARLDKIIEGLGRIRNPDCSKCVEDVADIMNKSCEAIEKNAQKPEADPVQQKLAETLNKAQESPKNATGEAKAEPLTTTPPEEEKPKAAEPTQPEAKKTVGRAELRNMAIKLSASDKKEQMKEIIRQYATKVSEVPEDKIAECYEKLVALEG